MPGPARTDVADRPIVAFVATMVVVTAVYTAFQLAIVGRINVLEAAAFAVTLAAFLVGVSVVRRRFDR